MRAGLLRHKVILVQPGVTRKNALGEDVVADSIKYERRAAVRGLKSVEVFEADKMSSESQLRFQFRYDKVVNSMNSSWQIVYDGKSYASQSPIDPDGRRHELIAVGTLME